MYHICKQQYRSSYSVMKTNSRLSSLDFKDNDIIKLITSLNNYKAHGHDNIFIVMIKICDLAIVKSLSIIFKTCFNCSTFPGIWKKSNFCPFCKKTITKLLTTIDLLPILGKYLKNSFLNLFLNILRNKNYSQKISLAFDQMTLVQISDCQLFVTYIQLSMQMLLLICVVFFRYVKGFQQSLA